MKVFLEMVGGYGFAGSEDWWMLRYESNEEIPESIKHNGKWIKYKHVCLKGQLDLSRANEYLKNHPERTI